MRVSFAMVKTLGPIFDRTAVSVASVELIFLSDEGRLVLNHMRDSVCVFQNRGAGAL